MPATLDGIRAKVRRLTRAPSTAQLSASDLDDYINDFILYDFPESIRLFNLRKQESFTTIPYVDTYDSNTANSNLSDFINEVYTVHPPIYIAGERAYFSQSREQFYSWYPLDNSLVDIATGDGATTTFTGTLSDVPILRNNVTFTSVSTANNAIVLVDDGAGNLVVPGSTVSLGTINYVTGAYDFTFTLAPANGTAVTAMTIPYQAQRPRAVLFFDGGFVVRPVPDKSYTVNFEYYARPLALDDVNQTSPQLEEWWQYIAYGAAIRILQDRLDQETVQLLMPEFKNQERLILRRTLVQQTNERVATIYADSVDDAYGPSDFGAPF